MYEFFFVILRHFLFCATSIEQSHQLSQSFETISSYLAAVLCCWLGKRKDISSGLKTQLTTATARFWVAELHQERGCQIMLDEQKSQQQSDFKQKKSISDSKNVKDIGYQKIYHCIILFFNKCP